MKFRAILLIAIFIGGMYVMIQSMDDYKEKEFNELLNSRNDPFVSLLFSKPSTIGASADTWVVDEDKEIENLLLFLQNYHVRKMKPEEVSIGDHAEQFSISLHDNEGNTITIIVNENVIIENSLSYYKIVDGPLDVEWLVQFFVQNQAS